MAFFKFGLAQESGVDALLDKWEQEIGSPSTSPASPRNLPASPTNAGAARQPVLDAASPSIEIVGDERASGTPQASASNGRTPGKPTLTLEQLLEEDDLLQECKNSHSKLLDFLSMPHTVRKMLDYASGEAFDSIPALAIPPSLDSSRTGTQVDPLSASSTVKTVASGPNPSLAEQARLVLSPKISPKEREQNRKRIKYPYLCTEILTLDLWPISDTIFNDTDRFLLPFWNAILDKQPLELAEISVHAGHWSKINIQWLSHGRVPQFLRFLKTIPRLFPRMLAHLPYISPVFDVLVKLVNTDDSHPRLEITDWLHKSKLVPQVLSLLDPQKSPIEAHAPASEFLRSIIAAASAASAAKQQQQQQESAKLGEVNGDSLGLPPLSSAAWSNWPNNTLVRELASQETMDQLLGYVLDHKVHDTDGSRETKPDEKEGEINAGTSQAVTAQPGERPSRNAITSSLLHSLTIIIDLIRKNNSDFTELQIYHFLERTVGGSESGSVQYGLEGEGEEGFAAQDHGPSLVDLEPLLRSVTKRLPELHQLLSAPRSDISPVPTTLQGLEAVEPLTFERFRICELYAELLHCSNMAILNRASTSSNGSEQTIPTYDSITGRIKGSREEAYGRLSRVLNGSPDVSPSTSANQGIANRESTDDTGEAGSGDASLNNRPVTAESIATSSYDSEADTVLDNKSNDHDDVFDQINVAADDLSLSESGSQKAPSAASSPMPPSTGTFSSDHTLTPTHTSPQENTAHDAASAPPTPAGRRLPPGPALKQAFIELEVVPTVMDLFFKFPWNNFLHNVVYDLIQQIFNGKTDDDMNRQLCAAVFTQRKGLVARILDVVEENNAAVKRPHGVRLGHMGHLTLISEEVVKLFYQHADWILPLLPEDAFDNAEWEAYIDNTFRETRERDLQQLGGGISLGMHASASTGSGGHGIIEMDDEFPPSGSRGLYAGDQIGSPETSPDKSHFARYLASQISSDYQEATPQHNALNRSTSSSSSSGSSSSDDINEDTHISQSRRQGPTGAGLDGAASTWFAASEGDSAFDDYDDEGDAGGGTFGGKHRWHSDFDISVDTPAAYSQTRKIHDSTAGPGRQDRFGFDDRFDSLDPTQFGTGDSDDDDDDEFGPFSDNYAAVPSPGAATATVKGYSFDDDFGQVKSERSAVASREKLTPADWNSSFRSNYDEIAPSFGEFGDFSNTAESPMASPNGEFRVEDDDDFGDFASGEANNHGDYDFTQTDEPAVPGPAAGTPTKSSPVAPRTEASPSPSPSPSRRQPPSVPKRRSVSVSSVEHPPGPPAVTSPGMEVHGPGVHEGTHISKDGVHLETEIEVDGEKVIVQVPKDELALHPDLAE